MLVFSIDKKSLKKSLDVILLAVDSPDSPYSHAFCRIHDNMLSMYSTNKNRIAMFNTGISSVSKLEEDPSEFMVDPRKLSALIKTADNDTITLEHDLLSKSINAYVTNDPESKISMPSAEIGTFIPVWEDISKTQDMTTANAGLFMTGIKFIQGFTSEDKHNRKFVLLYAENDTMYATNGLTKIGAFKSDGLLKMETIMVPCSVVPALASIIDTTDVKDIVIKTTSKHIFISSVDGSVYFGFLKFTEKMIKFPISTDIPDADGFRVNRTELIKKLNRLSIAASKNTGINVTVHNDIVNIKTLSDRVSTERIPCTRYKPGEPSEFNVEYSLFSKVLSLFPSPEIDIYNLGTKILIRNQAQLSIGDGESENPTVVSYVAAGIMGMARSM